MIASLSGELRHTEDDRVHLAVGPIVYELLVPSADLDVLQAAVGKELTFHTLMYFQGDAGGGGNIEPRLIGFLRLQDKKFFEKFITVKGIGPKTALRALTVPVGEIAAAIEAKNTRFLIGLNGIGRRTAELMVAELAGKVAQFATAGEGAAAAVVASSNSRRWSAEEQAALAFATSPQIGLRLADAEKLLERVKSADASLATAEQILPEMLRLHSARM
jgi:Holliday junction DNA helicase RuvA